MQWAGQGLSVTPGAVWSRPRDVWGDLKGQSPAERGVPVGGGFGFAGAGCEERVLGRPIPRVFGGSLHFKIRHGHGGLHGAILGCHTAVAAEQLQQLGLIGAVPVRPPQGRAARPPQSSVRLCQGRKMQTSYARTKSD